jgi:hypothetical protein
MGFCFVALSWGSKFGMDLEPQVYLFYNGLQATCQTFGLPLAFVGF